jgi:hypothetical protein
LRFLCWWDIHPCFSLLRIPQSLNAIIKIYFKYISNSFSLYTVATFFLFYFLYVLHLDYCELFIRESVLSLSGSVLFQLQL